MNTQIEHWDDIKIAYEVARLGTLSAAAEQLGVHHSTVLRRVSALETSLNTRLFLRHARGYTPTESGNELFQVAASIKQQLDNMTGQLQSRDEQMTGHLIITTVDGFIEQLTPWFAEFCLLYPNIQLEVRFDNKRLRLDHGQAHIALRPGSQPTEPDYIAQPIMPLSMRLYASMSYLKRAGTPTSLTQLQHHKFIAGSASNDFAYFKWIEENIDNRNISYRTSTVQANLLAIKQGIGIGLVNTWEAKHDANLIALKGNWPNWENQLWLVTHVLMHRTARVQTFANFIKQKIAETT